jgi:D-aspartate ligase
MNSRSIERLTSRLRRLSARPPAAIVLGNGSASDLSVVRSFGRRRIPTVHLVANRTVGSFSGYGMRLRMPAVTDQPQAWLDVLGRIAAALRSPAVLFALMDEHCELIARSAEALRRGFRFVLPDAPTMERILDKRRQYAAAEAAGIRVPRTLYPQSIEDLASIAPGLRYPVILKPYTSYVGRPRIGNLKVLVLDTADDLTAAFASCTAAGARFMVQTIVPGADDAIFWYSGFWDEESRERAWFTVQKLRQFPSGFGDGCFQRTVDVPAVADQSRRLLAAFRYRGLVMVEFKRDPVDGGYVLMEINPRPVSGNQLGISAGVDLAWTAYRHALEPNADRQPPPSFRPNVTFVNEEWDILACWALLAAKRLTLRAWLRSLLRTRSWAVSAWDDPTPALVGLGRMLRRIWISSRGSSRRHPTDSAS